MKNKYYLLLILPILICYHRTGAQALQPLAAAKNLKEKNISKVSSDLFKVYETNNSARGRISADVANNKLLFLKDGYIGIDAIASNELTPVVDSLKKLGMKNISVYGKTISGMLPVTSIPAIGKISSLKFARPAYKPRTNIGAVTSQGDSAQRSQIARSRFGVDGKGTKIGVLSDTYNALATADSGVLSGDLPGTGNPFGFNAPVQVLEDLEEGSDEGRGMLEIIHDVAPGAKLAFNTAFSGQAGFANNIIALADTGCDVIVDDVIYFAEPFFQDGIIAQAVNTVVDRGVTYFSSAGNQGQSSYESKFVNSGIEPLGEGMGYAHDFGGGDILQQVSLPAGGTLLLILQWDDPFFSAGGRGAESDIDIFLLNNALDTLVAVSNEYNIGNDPFEGFFFENTGPDAQYHILITNAGGPDPGVIKYIDFEGWVTFDEYATNSSTLFGHANAKNAIAVGAARYNRTPAFGINPPLHELFSATGGTKILFDAAGNRIPAEDRRKPEITAPQGANTTFFGFDYEGDGFPNFFGTSAAAPHAAAVASLMIEARKDSKPKEILRALKQSAIDMDNRYTPNFEIGFDYATGAGLIQADEAISALLRGPRRVNYLVLLPACSEDPSVNRRWRIYNTNSFPVNTVVALYNSTQTFPVVAKPGSTYFTTPALEGSNIAILNWRNENNETRAIPSFSLGTRCNPFVKEGDQEDSQLAEVAIGAYPNPAKDVLHLQLGNMEMNGMHVTLTNSQGSVCLDRQFAANEATDINLVDLPAGLYLLKAGIGGYEKILKIVKQ